MIKSGVRKIRSGVDTIFVSRGSATALASPGPKVAYCRSGNRSTVLWALSRAGLEPADGLIQTAAQAGYDISGMRPLIESLASRGR